MRAGLTDGGRVVADRLTTWHRPVDTQQAGRICGDIGCDTVLSVYNSSDRCAIHRRFVTIIPRSNPQAMGAPPGERQPVRA